MEQLKIDGRWWIPGSGHSAHGYLTVDASGLQLELTEDLVPLPEDEVTRASTPEWTVTPVIHGRGFDGQEVTLFEAGGANMVGASVWGDHEFYRPRYAAVGGLISDSQISEGRFSFDQLVSWTQAPSITPKTSDRERFTAEVAPTTLESAHCAGVRLSLLYGVEGRWGGDSVHLDRWVAFDATCDAPMTVEHFAAKVVRPVQNLLSVMIGVSVRLTMLSVLPLDVGDSRDPLDVYFSPNQADDTTPISSAAMASYTTPALFMRSELFAAVPFPELIDRWFQLDRELRKCVVQLLAAQYRAAMYSDHRFTTAFAAAENYAKKRYRTTELDDDDIDARVSSLIDAARANNIDIDVISWAEERLLRNDRRLAGLVDDLITHTGAAGQRLQAADPKIASRLSGTRGPVSHGASKSSGDALHWYAEVLRWLVRGHLAIELGMPPDAVWERVDARALFRRACKELAVEPAET